MAKQKILLTGSLGFLGSNTVRQFLRNNKDCEIVTIDSAVKQSSLNVRYLNRGHEFYLGDVQDSHFVSNVFVMEKPDIVIHMSDSWQESGMVQNIAGLDNLLKWSGHHGIKKFIYISSGSLYGTPLATPGDPIDIKSSWELGKQTAEQMIKLSGLRHQILRTCSVFGPRQSKEFIVPRLIKSVIDGHDFETLDDGLGVNDFIYVNDFITALKMLMDSEQTGIINVSSGWALSTIDLHRVICTILNQKTNLVLGQRHSFNTMDASVLRATGWAPELKLNACLEQTISWYANNYNWILR